MRHLYAREECRARLPVRRVFWRTESGPHLYRAHGARACRASDAGLPPRVPVPRFLPPRRLCRSSPPRGRECLAPRRPFELAVLQALPRWPSARIDLQRTFPHRDSRVPQPRQPFAWEVKLRGPSRAASLPRKSRFCGSWLSSFHLRPSSPLISDAFSPPTRAWTRGPVVITRASKISLARGASLIPTSMASKWLRTYAALMWVMGTSRRVPGPPTFFVEGTMAFAPPSTSRMAYPPGTCQRAPCSISPADPTMAPLP